MDEFSVVVLSLAGCVFAASAAAKLGSRQAYRLYRRGLTEISLIPRGMLSVTAALLVAAETVVAGGLLAAAALTTAAAPSATLLAVSALAMAALLTAVLATGVAMVIRRGTQARCACFGTRSSRPLGRLHLARNLSLLAVVCAGLAATPLAHGRPPLAGAALAAVAGLVAALVYVRWDDLTELLAPIPQSAAAAPGARRPVRRDI